MKLFSILPVTIFSGNIGLIRLSDGWYIGILVVLFLLICYVGEIVNRINEKQKENNKSKKK